MELLHDPELWVLIGFLVFFGALGKTLLKVINGGLDGRANEVRQQLNEAAALRAEAQATLDLYRSRQEQAIKDAADILEAAKAEAEKMRLDAQAELKRGIAAHEASAHDRIAMAEQEAKRSITALVTEIAIRAATGLVAETIDPAGANALVDQAIEDLPKRAA